MTDKSYKFSWKAVYDGWAKLVRIKLGLSKLTNEEKDIVVDRTHSCSMCEYRKFQVCGACGCYLPAKMLVMDAKCKKGLWTQ
jgi:hypothetical protein